MHILTKVFVLFASLLAILVAALTVSFAINADRVRSEIVDAQAAAIAAETELQQAQARYTAALNDATLRYEQVANERTNLLGEIQRLESSNARLVSDKLAADASRDRTQAQIGQLGETQRMQAQIIEDYRGELGRLRDEQLAFREQRADYEASLADRATQLQVYEDMQRALEERLAEAQRQIQDLVARGPGGGEGQTGTSRLPTLVRGRVQGVEGNLVQFNLGTNDQVRENVVMDIVRNGTQYVGRVVVVQADLNNAVARVEYTREGMQVQAGDQIVSSVAQLN